jgi:hypothetical protein
MLIAALFSIAISWKQCKSLLIDEWINTMWCLSLMDLFLALKRKELNMLHMDAL